MLRPGGEEEGREPGSQFAVRDSRLRENFAYLACLAGKEKKKQTQACMYVWVFGVGGGTARCSLPAAYLIYLGHVQLPSSAGRGGNREPDEPPPPKEKKRKEEEGEGGRVCIRTGEDDHGDDGCVQDTLPGHRTYNIKFTVSGGFLRYPFLPAIHWREPRTLYTRHLMCWAKLAPWLD